MDDLARAVIAGDPASLARAISLAEEGSARGERILAEVYASTGRASLIGITGPPGAGKSSLVNHLLAFYRSRGASLGVVAVDPSSAFSGGAVLGDRIRMQQHTLDEGIFIRSMATRGQFGGLSRATRDAVDLMDAAGRDPILIETVGVGQDEVDIVRLADTVLVVLTPGQGDDVQAIKAGLLEIADLFVVNKADHPGADRLASDLEGMLALGGVRAWTPPIVKTVATEGKGIEDLGRAVEGHGRFLREGDRLKTRRRAAVSARFAEILRDRLMARLMAGESDGAACEAYAGRLLDRVIDPYSAARDVLATLGDRKRGAGGAGAGVVLDHLGVAVRRIEDRLALYRDVLGLDLEEIEEVAGEGVRVALLPAGRARIELLEPLAGATTNVAKFLETRGEGIHHVCFEVEDLDRTLERFRSAGLRATGSGSGAGDDVRTGAEGSRIAFIHPRSAGGVLIELRETGRGKR
ncbi:MAG TPA: methylmalonyl Co-A mutase-associated GTPase MeaB [Candidatus Polarisedimenticolia bacterium]|jgi:LAO/AO transport system kinase|nr:methylmalonyl Co-A mutase-associated GTPase MeaB [Candidatus Polarisedimenticolia bacterium]